MRSLRKHTKSQTKRWQPRLETLEARRVLSTVWSDFNGDGFDDLAIGVPLESVGAIHGAGAVHILYGTDTGLSVAGAQFWTQDSTGVLDNSEAFDRFGAALASGDLNDDGRADLVIGSPGESIGAASKTGAVHILMGSATGLTATGNKQFHQDTNRVREVNESDDFFGSALTTGDFNGDGFTDFAVGTPNEDIGSLSNAGTINVFYGSAAGVTPTNNQFFHLNLGPMTGDAASEDFFGRSLAAGDFNNDGRDDVAVGIPYKGIGTATGAGAVSVIYGSANGLTASVNQFWHEHVIGISSIANDFDNFGDTVVAGDFDNDGRDDLAIGVPNETVNVAFGAGSVHVLYGTNGGLGVNEEQFFNQNDAGGNAENSDFYGSSLTAADFNGDGRSDLAVGAHFERVGAFGPEKAGAVNIMYGSANGITQSGAFEIVEDNMGTGDAAEEDDQFGAELSAGDFNNDGQADLVIAAPSEDIGVTVLDTGRVWSLHGAASGFGFIQSWGQDTPGMPDTSEAGDAFGGGLNTSGGRDHFGPRNPASLITADLNFDTPINKLDKRRQLSGRR
jgi:hypothetical protein